MLLVMQMIRIMTRTVRHQHSRNPSRAHRQRVELRVNVTRSWLIFGKRFALIYSDFAAAKTSSACPSTFTLRQIRAILPFESTKTVVRRTPIKLLPYMDFIPQAP